MARVDDRFRRRGRRASRVLSRDNHQHIGSPRNRRRILHRSHRAGPSRFRGIAKAQLQAKREGVTLDKESRVGPIPFLSSGSSHPKIERR